MTTSSSSIDTRKSEAPDNYYHGRLCGKHSNRLRYTANSRCIYCSPRHVGSPVLSTAEYEAKLSEQGGECAMCHEKPHSDEHLLGTTLDRPRLLDMDPIIGKLLCRKCITCLDLVNRDLKLIHAYQAYVEKHSTPG